MAAFQLPYLANQAAHCTGSSGDDKGVARVGFADLEKAKVGGVARHAQGTQCEAWGEGSRVRSHHRHPGHLCRVCDTTLHPTGIDHDSASHGKVRISGLLDNSQ